LAINWLYKFKKYATSWKSSTYEK